jgi:hypothetical protein
VSGSLWTETSCEAWRDALAAYPDVVAEQGSDLLKRLDPWYRQELPALLAERAEPFVTRDELVRVVEWKMARGVWRPRNLQLARSNDEATVREASRAAFAAAPDPRRPLRLLGELKGVGPATASAVLAARLPERYPFFDEVVAAQAPGLAPGEFTLKAYLAYAAALRERAATLAAACPPDGWDAQSVGLALWAAAGGKAAIPAG